MNIIDLTDSYTSEILKAKDLRAYEQSYPALFSHYFKYWATRKNFSNCLLQTELIKRKNLIIDGIKQVEQRLVSFGFEMENTEVVLFVGNATSNGHAFKDKGKFIVWLPLEGYVTKTQAEIFITHEIIHAFHYANSPDFYFTNVAEKRSVIRQVITEGVATYLTMKILNVDEGTALWADFISKNDIIIWLQECKHKEQMLYKFVLKTFSSSNSKIGLFYAKDPSDIKEYRAGYYVGLMLVESVAIDRMLSVKELLNMPRKKFENIAKTWLQERFA
ncbi:MAG: hypothetical protein JNL36_10140 [Candidatus Kapabacteria bacterium]|jgi:uncharacterized protein YjaZ|nr:hypothetical protein [Candidatus Kapabacteria bacterium]